MEDKGNALDADAGADDEESIEVRRAKRKAEKKAKREERRAREKDLVELKTTQALSAIASKALPEPSKCKHGSLQALSCIAADYSADIAQKRAPEESEDEPSTSKRKRGEADGAQSEDGSGDEEQSMRHRSASPATEHARTPSPETENRRLDQDLEMEMQRDLAGIPTFPLPTGPAKPSSKMLSMQGLPAALKDAERVSQDLRVSIDNMQIQQRRRKQDSKADDEKDRLSTRIRKRLQDTGIEEFFAGRLWIRARPTYPLT